MTKHQFIAGMGMGLAAGAALGMAMSGTKKREIKWARLWRISLTTLACDQRPGSPDTAAPRRERRSLRGVAYILPLVCRLSLRPYLPRCGLRPPTCQPQGPAW